MRTLLVLSFLLFFSTIVVAQEKTSLLDKLEIGYELGMGISQTSLYNHIQGFDINYRIANRIQVGTGIKYLILADKFNYTNSDIDSAFGFGSQTFGNVLIPASGHYLNVPIQFIYKFRKSITSLEVGLVNSFLVGAKGGVQESDINGNVVFFFDSFATVSNEQIPISWIEPYGFRKHHLRSYFSINFDIGDSWGMKVKYFTALTSLSKDKSEIPSGRDLFEESSKPMGFSVQFVYRFITSK